MANPISDRDLNNLKEQLETMHRDKDRVRLINQAAESFDFTCEQVKLLVSVQKFGDGKNQTAIILHGKLIDPENFEEVLSDFKFAEDKQEIRDAVGL